MTPLSFQNRFHCDLLLLVATLVTFIGAIALVSPFVAYNIAPDRTATGVFIALALGASVTFAAISWRIYGITREQDRTPAALLTTILVVGLVLRLGQLGTVPIFEDDWFRYLWEGALTTENISPYTTRPADGFSEDLFGNPRAPSTREDINALRDLSAQYDQYAYNVAYPYLSTIYPVGAQAAFAAASKIAPMSLFAWRSVLIGADLVAVALLLLLLRRVGRSGLWSGLYWLNPLVIITGFNGAHMDILLTAPMVLTFLFVRAHRPFFAGLGLGLCAAIKVWPLLLAPLVLRGVIKGPLTVQTVKSEITSTIARFLIGLIILAGPCLWPLFTAAVLEASTGASGLAAYTASWQKNALLFPLLEGALHGAVETLGFPCNGDHIARALVAGIVSVTAIGLAITARAQDTMATVRASLVVIMMLIFLAPAGYPWYAIWALVLLPFVPHPALVVLSATFFFYYARFAFVAVGEPNLFSSVLIPLEFGLPLLVSVGTAILNRGRRHHALP
ncbi:MAG: glycosyltransferase 87 family protein [Pseudomonadota bacterium]